jgi:FAD binding domain/Berberine and berberine like
MQKGGFFMGLIAEKQDALTELRTALQGNLIEPGEVAYDDARGVWNGMIDKYPLAIARCKNTSDVQKAVKFARANNLTIAVRGGGHNVAGLASVDGGIVIDLSEMNNVLVDPAKRIIKVAGGAKLKDIDHATQAFGLALSTGVVSATGIAGLTLNGGMGWLRRKYGLSCDNLIAAEVVTATGEVVRASEIENADLLWGLRGGGGNFGIVTSFEFKAHQLGPEVAFTFVFYPLRQTKSIFRAHEIFLQQDKAGDVSTVAVLGRVPHADMFPRDIHGTLFVGILGMYAGNAAKGEEVMRPLRELATPLVDLSSRMPYVQAQTVYDEDYPNGKRYYWKSTSLMQLSDDVIEVLEHYAKLAPSDHSTIDVWYHGGAIAALSENATAYGRRDIPYLVNPEANWDDPKDDAANVAWARDLLKELAPHAETNLYLNFPGFLEEGDTMIRSAFGQNYQRLVELKTKYDPQNTFRINQNIKPKGDHYGQT